MSLKTSQWDAGLYDERHSFVWKYGAGVLDLLDPQPGERILDLGCGTGHLTAQIAARGAEVLGIDASPEMIERAAEAFPALRFEVRDARDFTDAVPFDAVFSNAALHWIRPPEAVAASVLQALRPGGRFVAEMGGHGNVRQLMDGINFALEAADWPDRHISNYYPSVGEYATLLEGAGFRVTQMFHFDRPTVLEGGEGGLRGWLRMFARRSLDPLPAELRAAVEADIEARLRPTLHYDGAWHADYVRLRFVAVHP